MAVTSVSLRDFRSYRTATAELDPNLTIVVGPNGAGKTNLLEAVYFGCTGRALRTTNERELVRFSATATRVALRFGSAAGDHEMVVAFSPGEPKRMSFDGASVDRLLDVPERPLVSVFIPDRLGLIKGAPGLRRAHLDQFVAALSAVRGSTRRAYSAALAQRNAMLGRIRTGHTSANGLDAWDHQLARLALELIDARRDALELLSEPFADTCRLVGLDGVADIRYRPRSRAEDIPSFVAELATRMRTDLDRGYTAHGPHRDDLSITHDGRELRTYGSQGQQRLALLAMLLAEREVLADRRGTPPLLLLDDVMSELDGPHRAALARLLRERPGQALVTTTDLEHVRGAGTTIRIGAAGGGVLQPAGATAA